MPLSKELHEGVEKTYRALVEKASGLAGDVLRKHFEDVKSKYYERKNLQADDYNRDVHARLSVDTAFRGFLEIVHHLIEENSKYTDSTALECIKSAEAAQLKWIDEHYDLIRKNPDLSDQAANKWRVDARQNVVDAATRLKEVVTAKAETKHGAQATTMFGSPGGAERTSEQQSKTSTTTQSDAKDAKGPSAF